MIEVDDLTKYFGTFAAIENVSFTAVEGQVLGFLGPNGAGKTTTMRILTGYTPASSGTARVDGFDVFEDSLEVRRRIGYLPESPPLYHDMTPASFLDFVARIKGVDRSERRDAVAYALDVTDTTHVAHQPIGTLSRGYKQRVAISQALVHDPQVVILDEPTIGLDPKQIIEIRKLIKDLATKERTVVLSTHILPEVTQLCDKVVIIANGRIVHEDELDSVTTTEELEEVFLRVTAGDQRLVEPGGVPEDGGEVPADDAEEADTGPAGRQAGTRETGDEPAAAVDAPDAPRAADAGDEDAAPERATGPGSSDPASPDDDEPEEDRR